VNPQSIQRNWKAYKEAISVSTLDLAMTIAELRRTALWFSANADRESRNACDQKHRVVIPDGQILRAAAASVRSN
jgi:hypothetical protein